MNWPVPTGPVLVPYDFSEASRASLEIARRFVQDDRQLMVVYVVAPVTSAAPGVVWGTYDEGQLQTHAQKELEDTLAKAGFGQATSWAEIGHPAASIVDAAEAKGAELIVIPAHGRKGVERWLLGSVTERVVRHAPCPVLVLRARDLEGSSAD